MNQAVARLARLALELGGDNDELKMSAAAFGAFMPRMLLAVIYKLDAVRRQDFKLLLDAFEDVFHFAGPSSRCFDSISACSTANTSMRPMPPKSLKLTQVSVE